MANLELWWNDLTKDIEKDRRYRGEVLRVEMELYAEQYRGLWFGDWRKRCK